jgi:hypothetical protein
VVHDRNTYLRACCGRKLDKYDCSVHTGKTFESLLPADTSSTHRGIVRFSSSPSSTTTTILTQVTNSSPRATSVDYGSSLSLGAVAGAGIGTSALIIGSATGFPQGMNHSEVGTVGQL